MTVTEDGVTSTRHEGRISKPACAYSSSSYLRPDSVIDGSSVYLTATGGWKVHLARQSPVEADIVCGCQFRP